MVKKKLKILLLQSLVLITIIFLTIYLYKNKKLIFIPSLIQDSKNIIFLETNSSREKLTFKQSCAIESAAKNNPNYNTLVFTLDAKVDNRLFEAYTNIKHIPIDIYDVFRDSPLRHWWSKGVLSSNYRVAHLSDALRLILLYNYGGFYSDLDTITIRKLYPLSKFAAVGTFEKRIDIGNGFMHFPKKHEFVLRLLERFEESYVADRWNGDGPRLIQTLLYSFCNVTDLADLMIRDSDLKVDVEKSCDVSIYPHKYVYPYHWLYGGYLMKHYAYLRVKKFIQTFSIHFYGKISDKFDVEKYEGSVYEHYAVEHCPISYRIFIEK
jgi:lactosylceramide 4-alpha-galactosyltransferase